MSKQVAFSFAREHYIGDARYLPGDQASIDRGLAAALEKQGIGKASPEPVPAPSGTTGKSRKSKE